MTIPRMRVNILLSYFYVNLVKPLGRAEGTCWWEKKDEKKRETWVASAAANDVYIRADFWKSTYKVSAVEMKETSSIGEPSAHSEDSF